MSSSENVAWLLTVAKEHQIAIAESQLLEYVIPSQLHKVPTVIRHCSHLMIWRVRPIPIMQLGMLFDEPAPIESAAGFCVVAYQNGVDATLNHVGLPVLVPPAKIDISENQACVPPEDLNRLWSLPDLSLAFFSHGAATVPIVNIEVLCAINNQERLQFLYEPKSNVDARVSA